jgi:hypothetical protein
MPLPFNAQELVAYLRQVIWIMRRGPKDVAATTLAAAFFGAGTWLLTGPNLGLVPTGVSSYVASGCYGMGVVLLVWVAYRSGDRPSPRPSHRLKRARQPSRGRWPSDPRMARSSNGWVATPN